MPDRNFEGEASPTSTIFVSSRRRIAAMVKSSISVPSWELTLSFPASEGEWPEPSTRFGIRIHEDGLDGGADPGHDGVVIAV